MTSELSNPKLSPDFAYARLNHLLWYDRLPVAKIVPASDLPNCYAMTINNDPNIRPIILIDTHQKWGKTLVHEMLHIAEPHLIHGKLFDTIVEFYWSIAKKEMGLR